MTLPPSRLVIGNAVVVAAFRSLRSWSLPTTHGLHAPSIEADAARLAAATCHSATPGRASLSRRALKDGLLMMNLRILRCSIRIIQDTIYSGYIILRVGARTVF
ncbi:hypothetical protein A0H81_06964 [Grifola frondosa]|uniref:Uncharacterized protein n=1 Tax=Grifola frondosa TaxID=5627 RepID=A0A1C7M893_GRIFR|nr:hypothetical protein A0H81_06964 [Grifola frondosa]